MMHRWLRSPKVWVAALLLLVLFTCLLVPSEPRLGESPEPAIPVPVEEGEYPPWTAVEKFAALIVVILMVGFGVIHLVGSRLERWWWERKRRKHARDDDVVW